ncbi:MAG: glycogen synthase GlgA [Acidobacteriota bacterium]|nr:glycogen synthase GlgA [Blastocatellia bacterium]MDW8241490.1 glycogen synthase GlgA [Acidobacteriota bacterium]
MATEPLRVTFAASEVAPYAKTGGLADVLGALPKALARLGVDVKVMLPRYQFIQAGQLLMGDLLVPFNFGLMTASVYQDWRDSVPIYLIDAPQYFARDGIYGSRDGEYGDNIERFGFFSRAVLELEKRLGPPPHVIHCHDWQTGLIPLYLQTAYRGDPYYARTATLFTIHNLAYQGLFDPGKLPKLGFGLDVYRTDGGIEFHQAASAMKAGLIASTAITTVSPTYAREIQTPEHGCKLDGLLRARRNDLIGILNGVDYEQWSPEVDPYIAKNYSMQNLEGKTECKVDLLKRFGLPLELDRPLIGSISRLVYQKGFDLVEQAAERMLQMNCAYVVLGSGETEIEQFFQWLRDRYPDRVGFYRGVNNELAHQIEAGADIFLMPSRYEPCGLNQMYSLKYGTLPLVRGTGGLDDSVIDFDRLTQTGNGFKFYEYDAERLLEKFYEALLTYADPEMWRKLMLNAMSADFSWERSAREYLNVYRQLKARYDTAGLA